MSESVEGETVAASKKLRLSYGYILRTIKQRKSNLVRRQIRIAEQYIAAVGEVQFPLRNTR